jgi:hypothetical protein
VPQRRGAPIPVSDGCPAGDRILWRAAGVPSRGCQGVDRPGGRAAILEGVQGPPLSPAP